MRKSILIVFMLIPVLLVAPIAVRQVAANSMPSATSAQAEKGNDDTLYLTRSSSNNLTTTAPTNPTAQTITLGGGGTSTTKRWVNETRVPEGQNWNIPAGNYNFTFWMSRSHRNIVASVTFRFGYIDAGGQSVVIASSTLSDIEPTVGQVIRYNITVSSPSTITIYSGSRLFIDVIITVNGPSGQSASFYYDGSNQPTQIITPPISRVIPEFPFGAVFLLPALLSAYFILKRRTVRFRAASFEA